MDSSGLNAAELLRACLDTGEESAWTEFIARYQPLIAGVIGRMVARSGHANAELIDDLVQETYLKLCRDKCAALRKFKPERDESIFGYLKVVASSVVLDHIRSQKAAKRGPLAVPLDDGPGTTGVSHEIPADVQAQTSEMWRHIDAVAQNERDRVIFRLCYQQGYTANQVAALPGIGLGAKGVESCLHRMIAELRLAFRSPGSEKGKCPEISFGDMQ